MKHHIYILFAAMAIAFTSCNNDDPIPSAFVEVNGVVVDASYIKADIQWEVSCNATIEKVVAEYATDSSFAKFEQVEMDKVKSDKSIYSATLHALKDDQTYYIRCLVVNKYSSGTSKAHKFETKAYQKPKVHTAPITDVLYTSSKLNGTLLDWGSDTIPEVGFCYAKQTNVSIANQCVMCQISGKPDEKLLFSSIVTLEENSTYYVRAYAKNCRGVSYGEELKLTTKEIIQPSVTTSAPSSVSYTTATCGGNVTSDGGQTVTERGVCYSTSSTPTISNSKKSSGSGTGSFTCSLTGLTEGTTYYVRAYATNSKGTSYGSQQTFSTTAYGKPSVSTSAPSSVSYTTATCGGNVTSDGGKTVTERGVCYSTSSTPTISNSKKSSGSGTGSFTCSLTGLTEGTTYYVRAYATNSKGTSYGNEVTFTTNTVVSYIYYTSTSKLSDMATGTSSGLHTDSFDVAVLSHEFLNGVGTITFRGIVTKIKNYAFYECTNMTSITIPSSVTTIGNQAFRGCTGLTSVTIPSSVTTIGHQAFRGCTGLTSVSIPNSITSAGNHIFFECLGLTSPIYTDKIFIRLPPSYAGIYNVPTGITYIAGGAFYNCNQLTSVVLPTGITSIEVETFENCGKLASVNIPNGVTHIKSDAFSKCTKLTSITFPSSVTNIEFHAFINCTGMQSITCKAIEPPSMSASAFTCNYTIPLYVPSASINKYKQAEGWRMFRNNTYAY